MPYLQRRLSRQPFFRRVSNCSANSGLVPFIFVVTFMLKLLHSLKSSFRSAVVNLLISIDNVGLCSGSVISS